MTSSAGEILLSISYLPAANRLGVVVMKAKGLQSDRLKNTIGKQTCRYIPIYVCINRKYRQVCEANARICIVYVAVAPTGLLKCHYTRKIIEFSVLSVICI